VRIKVEKTISAIPEVKWSDVGGLENAKEDIYDTIQLPLKFPKLFNSKFHSFSNKILIFFILIEFSKRNHSRIKFEKH